MSLTAVIWVLIGLVMVALSLKRAVYGLSLYFFTFFALPQVWWWGGDLPDLRWNLVAGSVLLVSAGLQNLRGDGPQRSIDKGPLVLAGVLLANATLVHLFSQNLSLSLAHYTLLAKFVLLFLLVQASVKTEWDVKVVLWTFLTGAAYIGFEVTINNRGTLSGARLEGVGAAGVQNANQLASLFVTLLPLAGCLFFMSRGVGKLATVPAIAFVVNVLLLCNSRGAFLAGIVSAGVFLVIAPVAARKQALVGIVLGCLAVFALLGDARIADRFLTTFVSAEERDGSASERLLYWRAGARALVDHPLGSGGDAYSRRFSLTYLPEVGLGGLGTRSVHNGFLNEAIEWGLQGFILQMSLIAWLTYRVRSHLRNQQDSGAALLGAGLIASMAAFLVTSVFGDYLDEEWGYWLCGLMFSYSASTWVFGPTAVPASQAGRRGSAPPQDRGVRAPQWQPGAG